MKKMLNQLRMFIWMTFLTGIIYPVLVTMIAQLTMNHTADGNFISINEKIVGANLIGQKFESDKYFFGRPSAIDYNPLNSGGSNLGPTSTALKKTVEERREKLLKIHPTQKSEVPSELLFASGSGLDPHISVETAYFQIDRVSDARGLKKEDLENMIESQTIKRRFGFIGKPCINVLALNLALDKLK